MLHARFSRHKLVVRGDAAQPGPYQVQIDIGFAAPEVHNDNQTANSIAVRGPGTGLVTRLDLSHLLVSGAHVASTSDVGLRITGSAQDDTFILSGLGIDRVRAGGGNDDVFGYAGNDILSGDGGDDRLFGGDGNDRLTGGAGNDLVDGGAGDNILFLSGTAADYLLDVVNGDYRLTDQRAGGPDGVDVFGNIQHLHFSDRTIDLAPAPTSLAATISPRKFAVTGTAALPGHDPISVQIGYGEPSVRDNNLTGTILDVAGPVGAVIARLDLSWLSGVGADVASYSDVGVRVTGSRQADTIVMDGDGTDVVRGRGGADILQGLAGADLLAGGGGRDRLEGGDGADRLTGGRGKDVIDGGAGDDTAFYAGAFADYRLEVVAGSYHLVDLRTGRPDGTDVLGNVEHLHFSDRTVDIGAPTALTAAVAGSTLTVGGTAARSGPGQVQVEIGYADTEVRDDNATGNIVVVTGSPAAAIARLDLTGLHGAGAHVSSYSDSAVRVAGSNLADAFYLDGAGRDKAHGRGGDDAIFSGGGRDRLFGDAGDDRLYGGDGADRLTGGAGNDLIDGGNGNDSALYSGVFADYRLEIFNGSYQLTDLRGASPDGIDTIGNVEHLRFADQIIDLAPLG